MSALLALPPHIVREAVRAALAEDLGLAGDITTNTIIPADAKAVAVIAARKPGVVAGLALAEAAFRELDGGVGFDTIAADGERVEAGGVIARVNGRAQALLTAERVALNFLGHLSGVASATRAYADAIAHTNARICCTRKTTPGLRAFEKYAVRCGGGVNHRFGLFDAVLIKDNHIAAAGSVSAAIERARAGAGAGHLVKIEVEVDTLPQLEEALRWPIDAALLDNMTPPMLAEAVRLARAANPRISLEASGGVTLETVRAVAETGVDLISSGALTHSVKTLDVGFDLESA
jgi:nicotinate-nucleotide pyrophosphorylase (carboxylating)